MRWRRAPRGPRRFDRWLRETPVTLPGVGVAEVQIIVGIDAPFPEGAPATAEALVQAALADAGAVRAAVLAHYAWFRREGWLVAAWGVTEDLDDDAVVGLVQLTLSVNTVVDTSGLFARVPWDPEHGLSFRMADGRLQAET